MAGLIILAVFMFGVFPFLLVSFVIYYKILVRGKKDNWGRTCSMPEDEEYRRMFDKGIDWAERYGYAKRDAMIESDGLKLRGEFFDFGSKDTAIIIPGRMESLLYSYFFAEPYRKAGLNVLVIDNRSHGLSEGKVSSLGFREYRDILRWGEYLRRETRSERIVLHGICIGASTALFTLTSPGCPSYFTAMVSEGMYRNFAETLKLHIEERNHRSFPVMYFVLMWIRIFSGADALGDGPFRRIGKLERPVLFLHSNEDQYSLKELAKPMYDECPAYKEIVWFEKGGHSRLRIVDEEKYDEAIAGFLSRIPQSPSTV